MKDIYYQYNLKINASPVRMHHQVTVRGAIKDQTLKILQLFMVANALIQDTLEDATGVLIERVKPLRKLIDRLKQSIEKENNDLMLVERVMLEASGYYYSGTFEECAAILLQQPCRIARFDINRTIRGETMWDPLLLTDAQGDLAEIERDAQVVYPHKIANHGAM